MLNHNEKRREREQKMAPRVSKRKAMEGDEEQAKPQVVEAVKRVTRSMTSKPVAKTQPSKDRPNAKAKAKAKAKTKSSPKSRKESVEDAAHTAKASPEGLTAADGGSCDKTVVIEHCKQCNSFKTRAFQVKYGLEKGVPGVKVTLNPEKPRRGCFEIREEGGDTFISLLDMKRPFKPMKDLYMEKVISDIIEKIK
ncbi:selenoprotein H-like [Hibiscus syriacus]|uniref:selenoprotein H-like n=1 Tax=Hibiscus syriacus TaxID=106335 RepID=UPI0019229BFE|nr:selenoprotein H-like [Hibiscus syriacus]